MKCPQLITKEMSVMLRRVSRPAVLVLLFTILHIANGNVKQPNGNVIPYRYNVSIYISFDITFNLNTNEYNDPELAYSVGETIELGIIKNTSYIDLYFLTIISTNPSVKLIDENGVEFSPSSQIYNILVRRSLLFFDTIIPGGRNYTLHIPKVSVIAGEAGFNRVPLQDEQHFWMSSRYNSAARFLFPVIDVPQSIAIFSFTFYTPKGFTIIGNSPVISHLGPMPDHENLYQTKLEDVYLPPHALGFVLSNLPSVTSDNTRIRFHYPAHRSQQNAKVLAELFNDALMNLERNLNVSLHNQKVDIFAIPALSGTITKWGLIFINDKSLLVDETDAFVVELDQLKNDINCALSELWMGLMISPDYWSHVWLTKGLSRYLCSYVHSNRGSRGKIQFVVDIVQKALREDNPDNRPLTRDADLAVHVDEINYPKRVVVDQKAASVLRMIANLIGEDNFNAVVQQLIAENQFGAIDPEQLYGLVEKYATNHVLLPAGVSVRDLFSCWETIRGYPIVNVERKNTTLMVSQMRYKKCHVPITYVTLGSDPNQTNVTHWLGMEGNMWPHLMRKGDPAEMNMTDMPADWILVNNWQTGLYRVRYGKSLWTQLIDQLLTDPSAMSVANRVQLIDDSANLAADEEISYSIFFDLIRYVVDETDSMPWKVAASALTALNVKLRGLKHYDKFQKLLLILSGKQYLANRIRVPEGIDNFERMMAVSSIACLAGNKFCIEDAENHLINSTSDGQQVHGSGDFQYLIYCTLNMHLKNQTRFYNYFLSAFQADRNSDTVLFATKSLGCSHNVNRLERLYRMSTLDTADGPITLSVKERTNIFRSLIQGTSTSTTIGLNYVLTEFPAMADKYTSVEALFEDVGTFLVTSDQVQLMQTIHDRYKNHTTQRVLRTMKRELQVGQQNLYWQKAVEHDINDWLEPKPSGAVSSIKIPLLNLVCLVCCVFVTC